MDTLKGGDSVAISFNGDTHAPVEVKKDEALSLSLNASNSPLLFGCRIGICGTCTIEVEAGAGFVLPAMEFLEEETLSMYAPGNPRARLACQLKASCPMRVKKLDGL